MTTFCTCGRVKRYEDCCRPLHYLPFSQFRRQCTPTIPRTHVKEEPLPSHVGDLLTWPRYIIYLNGGRTKPSSEQITDTTLYLVRLTLKRSGYGEHPDRVFNLSESQGMSHFRIRDEHGRFGRTRSFSVTVNEDQVSILGVVDKNGYLTAVTYGPFQASSFEEAEYKGHFSLAKALSLLSLRFDSPLEGKLLSIEQLFSGRIRYLQMVPDWEISVPPIIRVSSGSFMQSSASFYREGLASLSPLYSFLCFYKCISVVRYARKHEFPGINFSKDYNEKLPPNEKAALPWLKQLFFGVAVTWNENFLRNLIPAGVSWGMSFGQIIENTLRPQRNKIAHACEDPSAETIDPDDPESAHEIRLMLPLIKLICRTMLKNTYPELLSQAKALPTVDKNQGP